MFTTFFKKKYRSKDSGNFYEHPVQEMPKTFRRFKRRGSKRVSKRSGKRTRNYRRRRTGRRKAIINPSYKIVHLRYVEVSGTKLVLPSGASATATQWNLNNAYDFNPALGTTTMPGFNEWAGFYTRYKVLAVKPSITVYNGSSTAETVSAAGLIAIWWIEKDNQLSIPNTWSTMRQLMGNPKAQWKVCPYSPGAGVTRKLGRYTSFGKLIGDKGVWEDSELYDASVNAGPSRLIEGTLFALTADGSASDGNLSLNFLATFDLYIKFFGQANNLQS